jgi:hypothetical protein
MESGEEREREREKAGTAAGYKAQGKNTVALANVSHIAQRT